ncbi:MAG: hypothetical protein MSS76_04610 [Clostridium sp.]|nr:hypothetical protein [Clostridium sp.]
MAQTVGLLAEVSAQMVVRKNVKIVVWTSVQIHVIIVPIALVEEIAQQDVVLAVKQIVAILVQRDAQEPVLMVVKMI